MAAEKVVITTERGERVEATAPVIISASRSTDIPAFFAEWFFHRLAKGYCVWYNPFNQQPMYISFARCRAVVFWTKDPRPILPYLHLLDERGIHYYFQVTLNDYEPEDLEPNVPPLGERIATFHKLSQTIGHERVIWRFDPIIMAESLPPQEILSRIERIGDTLNGMTDKLVFSFVDVRTYRKVLHNLVAQTRLFTPDTVASAEPSRAQQQTLVEGLVRLRQKWRHGGWELALATCAEGIDLHHLGIEHNRCIDGELMARLWPEDEDFVFYLRHGQWPQRDLFGQLPVLPPKDAQAMKDKGQRKACGCMLSKDIGMYNTCRHFCVYCYANTSRKAVERNLMHHTDSSDSLIGLPY